MQMLARIGHDIVSKNNGFVAFAMAIGAYKSNLPLWVHNAMEIIKVVKLISTCSFCNLNI